MNKKKKIYFLICLLFTYFFSFQAAWGAGSLVPCGLNGAADCTLCHLIVGFKNVYDYLLELLLVATTVTVVVAGIVYMVSSGNKALLEKAKSILIYALTAMILALTAWLIINATLNALGYRNAGNWWTFTCDTTQTPANNNLNTGITLPGVTGSGGGAGTGKGSYTPSGNLDAKTQRVLSNYMAMVNSGMKYGVPFPEGTPMAGKETTNCGSTCSQAWMLEGLPNLWNMKRSPWDGEQNSLKPGDICLLVSNDPNAKGDNKYPHAFMIMDENGMTTAASDKLGITIDKNGVNNNNIRAKNNNLHIEVVHIADHINK